MQNSSITRLLATALVSIVFLSACVKKSTVDIDVPEEKGPKWGFIDHSGKFVIKPVFRRVKRFTEGLAGADLHARWGFIDRDGKFIIERNYEDVQPFSAGLAGVQQGGKWYVINKKGTIVWPSAPICAELGFPHEVDPDAEDHAVVIPYLDDKSKKWGFHDFGPHGKGDIPCQYDEVKYFNDGLCPVFSAKKEKWGYINNSGTLVIDYKFDTASAFKNRVAECTMGDDFVWVDKIGTIAVKNKLDSITIFHDGLALQQRHGKFIFIKHTGEPAFRKKFRYADNFSEGLAVVQPMKTGKRGYVDTMGELVMPPVFDDARGFSEQLAAVKVDPDRFFKEYNEDLTPKNKPKEETDPKSETKTEEGKPEDGKSEEGKAEEGKAEEGKGEGDSKSEDDGKKDAKVDDGESKSSDEKSEGKSSKGDADKSGKSGDDKTETDSDSKSESKRSQSNGLTELGANAAKVLVPAKSSDSKSSTKSTDKSESSTKKSTSESKESKSK
jgi:hypothetical protein